MHCLHSYGMHTISTISTYRHKAHLSASHIPCLHIHHASPSFYSSLFPPSNIPSLSFHFSVLIIILFIFLSPVISHFPSPFSILLLYPYFSSSLILFLLPSFCFDSHLPYLLHLRIEILSPSLFLFLQLCPKLSSSFPLLICSLHP